MWYYGSMSLMDPIDIMHYNVPPLLVGRGRSEGVGGSSETSGGLSEVCGGWDVCNGSEELLRGESGSVKAGTRAGVEGREDAACSGGEKGRGILTGSSWESMIAGEIATDSVGVGGMTVTGSGVGE